MRRVLLVLVLLALAPVVSAEPPNKDQVARRAFLDGAAHFRLQHYAEAAEHFARAYRLTNRASLLFDLGQAHRLAGHLEDALTAYREYMRRVPERARDTSVATRIKLLEAQLADEEQGVKTKAYAPPPPDDPT